MNTDVIRNKTSRSNNILSNVIADFTGALGCTMYPLLSYNTIEMLSSLCLYTYS